MKLLWKQKNMKQTKQQLLNNVNWFNPQELLSYNKLINFVVGVRGGGKTFNSLVFVVNRFLKSGEQFIYLRRTVEELKDSVPTLLDDVLKHGYFSDHEFKTTKKGIYCDGKLMGLPRALSTSMTRKSIALPNVQWILFEEFMLDEKLSRYLGTGSDEVFIFDNFYETVARMKGLDGKPVRVIFISNAFSTVNIYFQEFKVKLPKSPPFKRYYTFDNVAVCIWTDKGFIQAKQNDPYFQLRQGSEFTQHAFDNAFILDTDKFLKHKTNESEYSFSIDFQKNRYSVWVDFNQGAFFVSTKGGNATKNTTISFTLEDDSINNVGIRRVRTTPIMKEFRKAFDENRVFYDKLETYHNLREVLYLLNTVK